MSKSAQRREILETVHGSVVTVSVISRKRLLMSFNLSGVTVCDISNSSTDSIKSLLCLQHVITLQTELLRRVWNKADD